MSYEKQTWNCGDTITADKLNHIENGIESASSGGDSEIFWVTITYADDVLSADKTFAEIEQAVADGKLIMARYTYNGDLIYYPLSYYDTDNGVKFVQFNPTFYDGNIDQIGCNTVYIDSSNNVSLAYQEIYNSIW